MLALLYKFAKSKAPKLSATEAEALNIGDPWWEADILSGSPSWLKLKNLRLSRLEPEEQAFLDNETEVLCGMLDEWQIVAENKDLPPAVWDYIRDAGFWGLVIPKEFGGKGFSALLHSAVIMKIATKSLTAAVTVMVPNSLGPGELILRYGTKKEKDHYLPRLAKGDEVPCFALTSAAAGSDATSMIDYGVICKDTWKDKKVLGIKLSFSKRYITLAPVATLIGLAVKLRDPGHLLGETEDLGITLCLMERSTPGLIIGNRHIPLDQAFMNGTVEGHEVFVPLDAVIGGKENIGKGWTMLVECLSVGRAISLPAISAAYGALSYLTVGAYTSLREQFHLPLKDLEGVQASMAEVAGYSYILDACRLLTLTANDQGQKPAVASAIAKYHMTELARKTLNHAMDIHGGRGIMMGPSNYLGRAYQGIPICITVEGANILTRNLMIFGQGMMLDHPYLRKISESLTLESKEGKKQFSKACWGFMGSHIALMWNRVWLSLTGGFFIETPSSRLTREYRKVSILSNRFALLADLAIVLLGGKLKRKECLSARLGDVMSELYMASAVLKYYQNFYEPESEEDIAKWAVQHCLHKAYTAMSDFIDNFAKWPFRPIMRFVLMPLKGGYKRPSDKDSCKVAKFMTEPSSLRDRFKSYCHGFNNNGSGMMTVEPAYQALQNVRPLLQVLKEKIKAKEIDKSLGFFQQIEMARDKEFIGFDEWQALYNFGMMRDDAVQVDAFTPDLYLARRRKMNMNVSLESQFNDMVERVRTGNVDLNPTPAQKLELYALYKQATEGDVTGEAPGATDFIARAKYQAWEKCKGKTKSEAMQKYIEMFG